MRSKIFLIALGILLLSQGVSAALSNPSDPPRFSTWYWLNSISREKWEQDFKTMADTGFTDVMLCWGLDAAAVLSQQENTRFALDLCLTHGLKAYLLVWHPSYNKLPRDPQFQQVDNNGNLLFTFNLFHKQWRATQWKNYLQGIATAYKDHPAFAGYLFDDTFYIGQAGSAIGNKAKPRADFVSYSGYDYEQFRHWLKRKYSSLNELNVAWKTKVSDWESVEPPRQITKENDPIWRDWCDARLEWLNEWATDTVKFIRDVDRSPQHNILLEDGEYVLGKGLKSINSNRPITMTDSLGLKFGLVTRSVDAVCCYTVFNWNKTDALGQATNRTAQLLQQLRAEVSDEKKIIYTFWVADSALEKPPSNSPDANQIAAITRTALDSGVRHIDYYGFRIGDWRVSEKEWQAYRSGAQNYPVVKSLPGRFLCDRPDVLEGLKKEIKRLRSPEKE